MKYLKYLSILFAAAVIYLTACSPEYTSLNSAAAPDSTKLSFTVTQLSDFKVHFTNTSSITGIASFDLGNGTKVSGDSTTAYYPMPQVYTIVMTVFTKGGSATVRQKFTQTKTDYSLFTSANFINISGGMTAANGKSWQLDSMTKGHLGVGPVGGADLGTIWWSAGPLEKTGVKMYDDYINFKQSNAGLIVTYVNHGQSYVNKGLGKTGGFTNPVPADLSADPYVNFTPAPGTWMINGTTLQLTSSTPIFPCYYAVTTGAYTIISATANRLILVGTGFDGNWWHFELIPMGYVKPIPSFTLAATLVPHTGTVATENLYTFGLANVVTPGGSSIASITYDFGDATPTQTTTDPTATFNHQYVKKGSYVVTATATSAAAETIVKTTSITITANLSTYTPYLINALVVYNDFGETVLAPLTAESGNVGVSTVTNPKILYPNRSTNVGKMVKYSSQYDGARITLPNGGRFNMTLETKFTVLVYGTAGTQLNLNLINSDMGGNAWQSGTMDNNYTIKSSNTWEVATWDMAGVPTNTGGGFNIPDVTQDPKYNQGYYNVLRLTINNGTDPGSTPVTMYVDDISGPQVPDTKKK